jgi:DNA-binding NarL/FixJ family response regulator
MIDVVLVDDHVLFREGLRALLGGHGDIAVVASAGDAREGKQLLDEHPAALAIVDVALPGQGGLPLVRDLKRDDPRRRVLVLSMHSHLDVVADAFDHGADGYALKTLPPAELVRAVQLVAEGGRYVAPGLEGAAGNGHGMPLGLLRALSRREREIFDLLVRGDRNRDIAQNLFISVKTVETHRTRIMRKLEVHNIGELVRLAVRHGHLAV